MSGGAAARGFRRPGDSGRLDRWRAADRVIHTARPSRITAATPSQWAPMSSTL